MERLIKLLDSLNVIEIAEETANQRLKSSKVLNVALRNVYPHLPDIKSSKTLLINIWNSIIGKAASRDGKITRIWLKLFKSIDRIIKVLFDNENTSEAVFVSLRKPIKDKFGASSEIYKQSIYRMGISRERSIQKKREYAAKVKVRNTQRNTLAPIYLEDVLDVIQQLKKSNDPYEQAIAVMLATGARSIEVFKVSTFKTTEFPTSIWVKGIAKDKGNNRFDDVIVIRDLVGLTGNEVVELVDDIRNTINTKGSLRQITDRTNLRLNKVAYKYLQPLYSTTNGKNQKITSHKCRYIYGNCAYLLYAQPQHIPYESYIQEQLAHLSGESTKSYLGINIKVKDRIINDAASELKTLFEKEINDLKQKIEACAIADNVDLAAFKNSYRQGVGMDEKIANVVAALNLLKQKKMNVTQRDLRTKLGYSSSIMTAAYNKFRSSEFSDII